MRKSSGEIKRVMEEMGYTVIGDYRSEGIARDWIERMGLLAAL